MYDKRCLLHTANYKHVEGPARVRASHALLAQAGLLDKCVHLEALPVSDASLLRVHPQAHVNTIDATADYPYGPDEADSETEVR